MADLTGIKDVDVGDEVVIMGAMDGLSITADELAEKSGTISYEILSRIGTRIPRVFLQNGEVKDF
jgi:alanine racemase